MSGARRRAPRPAGTENEFEFQVRVVSRDGTEATNFLDCYKAGHFVLEAKDQEAGKSPDLHLLRLLDEEMG